MAGLMSIEEGLVLESDGRRMAGHEIPMQISQSMREIYQGGINLKGFQRERGKDPVVVT